MLLKAIDRFVSSSAFVGRDLLPSRPGDPDVLAPFSQESLAHVHEGGR